LFRDREAEPGAAETRGDRIVGLGELLEDFRLAIGLDTDPRILDLDDQFLRFTLGG